MKFHQSSKSRRVGIIAEFAHWIKFYGFKSEKPWILAKEYGKASLRRRNKWGRVSGCKLAQYRASPLIRSLAKNLVKLTRAALSRK